MKSLCILGSTGSIGTQTLQVAEHLGFSVSILAANNKDALMEQQIRRFHPPIAVLTDPEAAARLRNAVRDTDTTVFAGTEELMRCIREEPYDVAVNGICGMAGTLPTVEVVRSGHDVVTANKESIVTGWQILAPLIREKNISFLSCDSEHSAIQQCIADERRHLDRILLTASGGPFFGKTENELRNVTAEEALRHPNWSMGGKITIDCATMMNKGLEIIEAVHLFDIPEDRIDVVIHRESIIHSMVSMTDGSVRAQMSMPDMRLPIQYALTYPDRFPSQIPPLDLAGLRALTFYEPQPWAQRAMGLARRAVREGGTAPTVLNTANEIAVEKFFKGALRFTEIVPFTEAALNETEILHRPSLEDILNTDNALRQKYTEA